MKEQTNAEEPFQRNADDRDARGTGSAQGIDGMPVTDLGRRHALGPATCCKLKARSGGMDVCGAARLKALEDENARRERLSVDTMPPLGTLLRNALPGVDDAS